MADQTTNGASVSPEITSKAQKPPGILPKNAQTWAMAAIAVLMVTVIAFSSGPTPKAKTSDANSRANAVVDPNQRRIQDYRQEVAEQTRKLADEQARLEKAKQDLGSLNQVNGPVPTQAGTGGQFQTAPYGVTSQQGQPVVYTGQTPPPTTKSAIEAEREKREYTSLFASNIALSLRKEGSSAPSTVPPLGDNSAPQNGAPVTPTVPAPVLTFAVPVPPTATATTAAPKPEKEAEPKEGASETRRDKKAAARADDPELQSATGKKYRLFEGTVVETVLTNRLTGEFSGPVNCMVTTNVYSRDHQQLLIPQGSRVLGEATKVSAFGQQRLAVFFHRIVMPDGFSLSLDDFHGLSQIGETGLRDQVNHHYIQIFGTSLAIGAIAGLAQANTQYGFNTSALDNYRQGVSQSLSQSSLRILDRFLNVLPTFTIREGNRVKVYLSDDLLLPSYEHHKLPGDL
jgi:type IV secretion system protein VirB10